MWLCSKRARLRGLMGSAGSARLDTSVHDCRWLRRVTDQCSVTAAAVSAICITVIAPHAPPDTEYSGVQDTISSHSNGSVTASSSDSSIKHWTGVSRTSGYDAKWQQCRQLHRSRFRRERGSSIPGNSGMENDRDSRAPGKQEPGNAHPNYYWQQCLSHKQMAVQYWWH